MKTTSITLTIFFFLTLALHAHAYVPGAPAYAYPDPNPMTAPAAGQHNAGASWTHVTSGCTNSLLVVEVAVFGNIAGNLIKSVTYNGVNVPLFHLSTQWVAVFALQNPSPGSHAITVNLNSTYYWQAGAVAFCNTDPVRPLEPYGSRGVGYQFLTSPTAVSSWTSTVPSAPGTWMWDAYYSGNGSFTTSSCVGCSQSKIVNDPNGSALVMSLTPPVSGVTSSNTWNISPARSYSGIALTVNPPQRAFPRVLNWLGSTLAPSGGKSGWTYKDGNYLHATTLAGCYDIYDISNPLIPPVPAVTPLCNTTYMADGGFVVYGDYAYEGARTKDTFNVIQVKDTSTHALLSQPVLVGHVTDSTNLLSVEGTFHPMNVPNVIMTLNSNGGFITAVDVSNPSTPTVIAKYSGMGAWDFAYDGANTLYAITGTRLQIIDVSTAVPSVVSTLTLACNAGYGPSLVGNYLYATCTTSPYGITVIDVSNRASPFTVNTVTLASNPGAITSADGTLVPGGYEATTGSRCLYAGNISQTQYAWAFDIHTNPTTPVLVDSIQVANSPDDFKVYNGVLYISNNPIPAYYLMCR